MVEQRSPKPRVLSSSLSAPAKKKAKSYDLAFFSEIHLRRRLKACYETEYWLELFVKSELIEPEMPWAI